MRFGLSMVVWHSTTVFSRYPTTVRYKDMSEIPTRKRAAYRRRYELLDKLALDIQSSCVLYESGFSKDAKENTAL